jgi:hypothetical protein
MITMEEHGKPEPSSFERCGSFITSRLYEKPGLDGRDYEKTGYGNCVVLTNKHYGSLQEVSLILQCHTKEELYKIIVDPESPADVLQRAQAVAYDAIDRYGINVEVLLLGGHAPATDSAL